MEYLFHNLRVSCDSIQQRVNGGKVFTDKSFLLTHNPNSQSWPRERVPINYTLRYTYE